MKFQHPISVRELLGMFRIQATVKGPDDTVITGINELHSITPGDLSFVDNPKYYERMLKSAAAVIFIDKEMDCPPDKVLLITDDPLKAYLKVVKHFTSFHPQSEPIHPSAQIGEGTIIQPCTFIGENVVIGKNCLIHSNVSIYADTIIGDDVIIQSGSVIGADACYFQRRPEGWLKIESCGRVIIGSHVEIACNVCIDRGVSGDTRIGDGCKFDNLVQIGHDTIIGKNCLLCAQCAIAGCSKIEDDVVVWAKSVINKDVTIAKGTTILALSALDKSVTEENTTLFGVPAIDARKKWRELAIARRLPEAAEEFQKLRREVTELNEKLMKFVR